LATITIIWQNQKIIRIHVCFFLKTNDIDIFSKVEFYKNDIDILTSLGYSVDCCNRIFDLLNKKYDLNFVWWFGFGVFPSVLAFLFRKPCHISGNIHRSSGEGLSSWPFSKRILMKLCLKVASISLFTSITEIKRLGKFKPKNIGLLYNCVAHNVYFPDDNVKKKNVILCISNLAKEHVECKMILESLTAFSFF